MCAALTQGKGRMRGEGVPRALEGVKGLWPHEWGGGGVRGLGGGEDEQADGDGMRDHLDIGAGDEGMG